MSQQNEIRIRIAGQGTRSGHHLWFNAVGKDESASRDEVSIATYGQLAQLTAVGKLRCTM